MQESDWVEVEVGNQMEPRLDIQLQKVLISTYLVFYLKAPEIFQIAKFYAVWKENQSL